MKVLQINCVYNYGSTGKITHDIHQYLLSRGIESVVCYGRGERTNEPGVIKLCSEVYAKANNLLSRVRGTMYGGCYLSTRRLIRIIEKEKPDVVHLQCINGYFVNIYKLLAWLKKRGIKTVLTLHAEFMYTANCGHALDCEQWKNGCNQCPRLKKETCSYFFDRTGESWHRLHEVYRDWDDLYVVGCSKWICARASESGEMKNRKMSVIHNGIDNETIFYPRAGADKKIRAKYGIEPEKKLILFVAPAFSELKGFDLLLKLMDAAQELPFYYLLVGSDQNVKRKNVTVIGKVMDQNYLAELYSAADALVMCSRCENYPTVCLEAASCGAPVAGFDVGGVKETIPFGMGGTVPLGDIEAMKHLLQKLTESRPAPYVVEKAKAYHSKDRMAEEYIRVYHSMMRAN